MTYIQKIQKAINLTEGDGILLKINDLTGYSGEKIIGFLQRAAEIMSSDSQGCYLEIGVFQGLTLTSVAACVPAIRCYGIDNFSQCDNEGKNRQIVESRIDKYTKANACLINQDFEKALLDLQSHINGLRISVYFIDGPHDYRSQYLSLEFAKKYLSDKCVIVIDDSNYEHVRQANADWLRANPDFALLFESYTCCHPVNMRSSMKADATRGWWNGVNVIVRDIPNDLERIYPATDESHTRFLNDHILHSSQLIGIAPKVLRQLAESDGKLNTSMINLIQSDKSKEKYIKLNTHSEMIEGTRMAKHR